MSQSLGNSAFDEYFEGVYKERWKQLRPSLLQAGQKPNKVTVLGKTTHSEMISTVFEKDHLKCVSADDQFVGYQLDLASAYSVAALDWHHGDRVLDLCAAPGGKSLVSQWILNGEGEWHMNELSQPRLSRLKSVMKEFSPAGETKRFFYKRDASKWGMMQKNSYDKVLCDVPCSGEAHMMNSPSELRRWTLKSCKNLSVRQHAILCSALEAVKPGGEVLYSTCTINPLENDGVIEKFLKKRRDRVEFPEKLFEFPTEKTKYGHNLFPDTFELGPIYFSVIKKCQ